MELEPLFLETVWLKQKEFEDAECRFHTALAGGDQYEENEMSDEIITSTSDCKNVPLLEAESVWLKQLEYEEALSVYQRKLAGVTTEEEETISKPEDRFDALMSDLLGKHLSLLEVHKKRQKQKDKDAIKIPKMRDGLIRIKNEIDNAFIRMEKEIENYDLFFDNRSILINSLLSTVTTIKEKKCSDSIDKSQINWVQLRDQMKNIGHRLDKLVKKDPVPYLGYLDNAIPTVENCLARLRFAKFTCSLPRTKKHIPDLVTELESVKDKVMKLPHKSVKKSEKRIKTAMGHDSKCEDDNKTESLDGSLGDECLSDSWVSISESDLVDCYVSQQYGAGGSGGAVLKTKHQQTSGDKNQSKMVSKSKSKSVSTSSISPHQSEKVKSNHIEERKTPSKKQQHKPKNSPANDKGSSSSSKKANKKQAVKSNPSNLNSEDGDAESLDGSLGSEDGCMDNAVGAQRDLISCFASLQSGDGGGARDHTKSLSKTNTKKISKSSQSADHITVPDQTKKKTPSPQSKARSLEFSRSGRTFTNSTHQTTNPQQDPSIAVRFPVKADGTKKRHAQPVFYNKRELRFLLLCIKRMLKVHGPVPQLQEMLTEAELLRQMNHEHHLFKHRFSLLHMAFNYYQTDQDSVNPETSRFNNSNSASPKESHGNSKCPLRVIKIADLNPWVMRDNHRAGISSIVVLDKKKHMVLVDIINGCLKLFDIGPLKEFQTTLLVNTLVVHQPYYMTKFGVNKILVTRAEKMLAVVTVSVKKGLQMQELISCPAQYYGLSWVKEDIIACANYEANSIDLVKVIGNRLQCLTIYRTHSQGPELLSVIPYTGNVVFLERVFGKSMHLTCIDPKNGERLYSVSLGGGERDVWNLACVRDRVVCCCKQTSEIVLLESSSRVVEKLVMPADMVQMPFAICFSDRLGELYVANDAAWEQDGSHYVTTQVNVFSFCD